MVPARESLQLYLGGLRDEDWQSEFKTYAEISHGDFGVRRAIATLANHEGGEVFIGVRDDRTIVGTTLRKEDLYARLIQPGTLEDWYSLDLRPLAVQTSEVLLSNDGKRVLIVEVGKGALPSVVASEDGNLEWWERSGNTSRKLSAVEGVRALRRFQRGRLLLELYREFRDAAGTIPDNSSRGHFDVDRHFRLPRFDEAQRCGDITWLTERDREYLVAQHPQLGTRLQAPGVLMRFLRAGQRIGRRIRDHNELHRMDADWDVDVDNDLRSERDVQREAVKDMERWLRSEGVLPPVE